MKNKHAKFNLGDVVLHTRQGYRGIVIDIDAHFQPTSPQNPRTQNRDFANRHPWYRLLVANTSQTTYVEESLLNLDPSPDDFTTPDLDEHFINKANKRQSLMTRH